MQPLCCCDAPVGRACGSGEQLVDSSRRGTLRSREHGMLRALGYAELFFSCWKFSATGSAQLACACAALRARAAADRIRSISIYIDIDTRVPGYDHMIIIDSSEYHVFQLGSNSSQKISPSLVNDLARLVMQGAELVTKFTKILRT